MPFRVIADTSPSISTRDPFMKKLISTLLLSLIIASLYGCAGIKVVKPGEPNKNAGTKALDFSSGSLKVVSTHTCNLHSMGSQFSAVGKTEEGARNEVLAKCHDHAVVTFCKADQVTCVSN